ncbi:MAG: ROK family protein [Propioniciclava sp.]
MVSMSPRPVSLPTLRLARPDYAYRNTGSTTLALLARLIASHQGSSKSELSSVTGLSRTTVSTAVDRLLRAKVVRRSGAVAGSGRGRPADSLAIAPDAGTMLVFDCGAKSTRLSVANLAQQILVERTIMLDVADGPESTVAVLTDAMRDLMDGVESVSEHGCTVIGLPARLDYHDKTPVRPPIMPGWDGFRVDEMLERAFGYPVVVENDVNLRALAESRSLSPDQSPLVAVKVGTGIGAGLVTAQGEVHRGGAGAAGEIGHITLRSAPDTACVCGSQGCLEAVASVPALLRAYAEQIPAGTQPPHTAEELAALITKDDPLAVSLIRQSAVYLGEAIADIVHVFNPARVVITGPTTSASDVLLARIRSMIYEHARPLATRNLQVSFSALGERSGVAGAVVLGVERLLSPESLGALVYAR